jgi:Phosphoribosylpyrophosphate synthetase
MSEITLMGSGNWSEPINFVKMYSDGTPMVKTDQWLDIVARADTMVLRPHSLNSFVTAMFLVDAITLAGGRIQRLVLPYVPGARQDRTNPTGDVLFTIESVTRMINQRRFSRVVILDPHSHATSIRLQNVRIFPQSEVAKKLWQGYSGIISADKGGKERAEAMAEAMDLPVTYGGKTRDVSTGKLTGFTLDELPVKGGHYLVVDDICDGGGTFIGLAEKIREQGAYADLFVSHGIFSKGTAELKKVYKNIYTTDSRQVHERNDVLTVELLNEMRNYG